jgi:hypothetical protein
VRAAAEIAGLIEVRGVGRNASTHGLVYRRW